MSGEAAAGSEGPAGPDGDPIVTDAEVEAQAVQRTSWADSEDSGGSEAERKGFGSSNGGNGSRRGHGQGRGRERSGTAATRPRLLRPMRPDDAEAQAMITALRQTINKSRDRTQELSKLLGGMRAGGARELREAEEKVAGVRARLHTLLAQRKQLEEQLEETSSAHKRTKESLRELRIAVKLPSAEEIDDQIGELESRLAGDTGGLGLGATFGGLSAAEQKKVSEQIEQLRMSRRNMEELRGRASKLAGDSGTEAALQERIKEQAQVIAAVTEEESALVQRLAALRAEDAERGASWRQLTQERDECRAVIKVAYRQLVELKGQLDAEWAQYKAQMAAYQERIAALPRGGMRQRQAMRVEQEGRQGEGGQGEGQAHLQLHDGEEQQPQEQQQQQREQHGGQNRDGKEHLEAVAELANNAQGTAGAAAAAAAAALAGLNFGQAYTKAPPAAVHRSKHSGRMPKGGSGSKGERGGTEMSGAFKKAADAQGCS